MKRRSFLKLISMAATAIALPKLLVDRAPVNSYSLPPRGTPFPAFDPDIHIVASPVQLQNYRQLGYSLADCKSLLIEDIPQEFFDRFFSELPTHVNTDRRRIGRAIRKARRESASMSQLS